MYLVEETLKTMFLVSLSRGVCLGLVAAMEMIECPFKARAWGFQKGERSIPLLSVSDKKSWILQCEVNWLTNYGGL